MLGSPLGVSAPGIGPGRAAPEEAVPAPVDNPAGVTALESDAAPAVLEPAPGALGPTTGRISLSLAGIGGVADAMPEWKAAPISLGRSPSAIRSLIAR